MGDKEKVAIIAIDGATFDKIVPMIESGELPNFSKIMDEGVWAKMMSTYPPHTAPAWPVCASGVNPGKVGIFDFRSNSHMSYDEGDVLTSKDLKADMLWNILSARDKKVMVSAIPLTYPPVKVNGVMVSPVRLIDHGRMKTYPEELFDELVRELDLHNAIAHRKSFMEMHTARVSSEHEAFLDTTINTSNLVIEKLADIAIYLHKKDFYDFSMFMLPIDALQHHLWCYTDPDHPSYTDEFGKKYGNAVFDGYKMVDAALGRVFDSMDDGRTTFILVSDHGFGPLSHIFYANRWLMEKGLLKLKKGVNFEIKRGNVKARDLFKRMGIASKILDKIPAIFMERNIPVINKNIKSNSQLIDWSRTKAYAASYAINVNLKGREPYGIVDEGQEYKDLIDEIKTKLLEQECMAGNQLVGKVLEKHDIYDGPFVDEAPDIFVFFKDPRYAIRKDCLYPHIFRTLNADDRLTGHHTSYPEGICIMKGPNITPKGQLNKPNIVDIAPTVLYLMKESIPEGMDGRVFEEAVKKEFKSVYPVKYRKGDNGHDVEFHESDNVDESNKKEVEERLRQLGYLG